MAVGRHAAIVPTLAPAGVLASKPRNDRTRGMLRTETLFVGVLTFLPAGALEPIADFVGSGR